MRSFKFLATALNLTLAHHVRFPFIYSCPLFNYLLHCTMHTILTSRLLSLMEKFTSGGKWRTRQPPIAPPPAPRIPSRPRSATGRTTSPDSVQRPTHSSSAPHNTPPHRSVRHSWALRLCSFYAFYPCLITARSPPSNYEI